MARRCPLLYLGLAGALGIAYGRELSPVVPPVALWATAVGLLGLTAALYLRGHPGWSGALLGLVAAVGALGYVETRLPVERLYPLLEGMARVRGTVVSYPTERPDRTSFRLRPEGLPGQLQIFYRHPRGASKAVAYGDVVELEADFEVPWTFEDFDYRAYLETRGVWGVGTFWSGRQLRVLEREGGHPLLRWGDRARRELFDLIDRHLPEQEGGLLKGLLFGERAHLSPEQEASFRDAGVMHVLAVSGLHLSILLGLGWWLLRAAGLSATATYGVLLPLTLLYLTLVGFKVSLVRASLMLAFVALGSVLAERGLILRRWSDPLQGLSLAALVILGTTPAALFDVSFQLSFAATAGILLALGWAHPRLQRRFRRLRGGSGSEGGGGARSPLPLPKRFLLWVLEKGIYLVVISGAAQLAVAPVIAYHFQRLYVGAWVANGVVVPMVAVALWLGVLLLVLALFPVPVPVAALVGRLEGLWLSGLTYAVEFFARLPWAYVPVDGEAWATATALWPLLLLLALDPGVRLRYFAWAISRISAAKASPSLVKRSIARLATLRGRSERRA